MSKMLLLCLSFILSANIALANETPLVGYCDNTDIIIETYVASKGQRVELVGVGNIHFQSEGTSAIMTLWVNLTDGSWTIVATPSDDVSCIVMYGNDLSQIPYEST